MTINKKILYIFICIALVLIALAFWYLRDGGLAPAADAQPLTEQDKADVLKSLEENTSTASGSPDVLSDIEKRAVLDSLSGTSTRASSTDASAAPAPLSDEEKEAVLRSLEKR